uniref:Homeobox protein ARX n=1 Tax=Aceria tosichella TaxID=561515 RepID=A0A6G1S6R8_9ACAR
MNRHTIGHPTFQPASYYHHQHSHQYHHHHTHHQHHQHQPQQFDDHQSHQHDLFGSRHHLLHNQAMIVDGNNPSSPICSSAQSLSPIMHGCEPTPRALAAAVTTASSTATETNAIKKSKPKKARTMFSNYQLTMLETTFQQSPYPDAYIRRSLAHRLGLDVARVQVWFQNRRAKWRKKAAARAQHQRHQQTTLVSGEHSPVEILNMT